MADLRGTCDPRFSAVAGTLAGFLDDGDVGGSVAVLVDGRPVVDLWGGHADAARTRPWEATTLTGLWSVTKTVTALAVLVLVDRGVLDLDAPLARSWPEFAAAGKEGVLLRHVLSHSAGLPDWEGPVEELYDWPAATARLAATPPQWAPGTASGYHSLTQGHLLGELVRRATGRTVGRLVAEELAGPLGADVHLGLAPEHDPRVAPAVPPPGRDEDWVAGTASGTGAGSGRPTPVRVRDGNSVAWRRSQVPAASGYAGALAVARVLSVLACGGTVDGVRVLSPETAALAGEEQVAGDDRVLGTPVRWGLGYGLFGSWLGWGGWGGSLVMVDPDARSVVAYVTDQMREPADDDRGLALVLAAAEGLGGG